MGVYFNGRNWNIFPNVGTLIIASRLNIAEIITCHRKAKTCAANKTDSVDQKRRVHALD